MRHFLSLLLLALVIQIASCGEASITANHGCSIDDPPLLALVLRDAPSELATTSLHVGRVLNEEQPPSLRLYEVAVGSEMVGILEYPESDVGDVVGLGRGDRLPLKEYEPDEMWELGTVGPGNLRGLAVSDAAWNVSVVILTRSSAPSLHALASDLKYLKDHVEFEGSELVAQHQTPHVPGIGSIPLSPFAPIRGISYTNEHLRAGSEPQIAVALGVARTCEDVRPIDIYSWWYGPHVVPPVESSTHLLRVRYPSPALYGDVIHEIWQIDADHLATMTSFGLERPEFDRLRKLVSIVTPTEQDEQYRRLASSQGDSNAT